MSEWFNEEVASLAFLRRCGHRVLLDKLEVVQPETRTIRATYHIAGEPNVTRYIDMMCGGPSKIAEKARHMGELARRRAEVML